MIWYAYNNRNFFVWDTFLEKSYLAFDNINYIQL